MRRTVWGATCALLFGLGSCGTSFSQPEDSVRAFLGRVAAHDVAGARDCLVSNERAIARITPPTGPVEYEIGRAQVKGQHAKVPVVVVEGPKRTHTHWIASREDGDWRVSIGMTVAGRMFDGVQEEMNELGENATDDERASALRRGMQRASPGRD